MTARKTPAKKSDTLDTKDQSAKQFVESGASAQDMVKDRDAALRDEDGTAKADAINAAAAENVAPKEGSETNHNSMSATNPVNVDQADRPDYNPQRRPSSKANQQSAQAEGPAEMAERVDAKKDNPTNAEITQERKNRVEGEVGTLNPGESPFKGET